MKLDRKDDEFDANIQSEGVLASSSPITSILSASRSGTDSMTSQALWTAVSRSENAWHGPCGRGIKGKLSYSWMCVVMYSRASLRALADGSPRWTVWPPAEKMHAMRRPRHPAPMMARGRVSRARGVQGMVGVGVEVEGRVWMGRLVVMLVVVVVVSMSGMDMVEGGMVNGGRSVGGGR